MNNTIKLAKTLNRKKFKIKKYYTGSTGSYFKNRVSSFQSNISHYTRFSNGNSPVLPFYDLSKCQSSFFYKSINIWNYLPVHLKNETYTTNTNGEFVNIC